MTTAQQDKASPPEANGNGPEETRERSIPEKLLAAARRIENIDKDGHNDHFDYDFASAENILRHVRGPLADEGLWLIPRLKGIAQRQGGRSSSTITTATVEFSLVNVITNEAEVCEWSGEGDDPSDKGLSKAYTAAIKTFLRLALLLPLGDDPEADVRADARVASDSSPQLPADEKLPDEFVAMLGEKVDKAGLSQHLPMRLRGYGVDAIGDLTVEQGRLLWKWAEEPEALDLRESPGG